MGLLDDGERVEPASLDEWAAWFERNHERAAGVWLVGGLNRRDGAGDGASGGAGLSYVPCVIEALRFGWVDGRAAKDAEGRSLQWFAPRKPGSGWARTNKGRVEQLIAEGRMHPAGLAAVERAKADGSWTLLDAAEALEPPDDLVAALDSLPPAREQWEAFPPSTRKQHIAWVALAKRDETRRKRIAEIAEKAARGERA